MRARHRRSSRLLLRALLVASGLLAGAAGGPRGEAASPAPKELVLYSFCGKGGLRCSDGEGPEAGLIMDAKGNLYGTTNRGGANGGGTAFELIPNPAGSGWTQMLLYSFCAQDGIDCTDGIYPNAGLLRDPAGNLYGTTSAGGEHAIFCCGGTVFELIRDAAGTKYTRKTLYSFCRGPGPGCADGAMPVAGLIRDAKGNLYGTTQNGGAHRKGTVFELTPNAARTAWTQTVLYSFCAQRECADGAEPRAGLLMDKTGNLFGTTYLGAGRGYGAPGTVFELIPSAAGTAWTAKVLYTFCAEKNCADGTGPLAGLIMDAAGNLYGTTAFGGANSAGTVFELTPNAAGTAWTQRVLYSVCAEKHCTDARPLAGLIMDTAGNLYGTTAFGGAHIDGTVFELTPNAAGTEWAQRVLYSFCGRGGTRCTDGAEPAAGLIMDKADNLYGTTLSGGAHNQGEFGNGGTVFELKP